MSYWMKYLKHKLICQIELKKSLSVGEILGTINGSGILKIIGGEKKIRIWSGWKLTTSLDIKF